MRKKIIILGAMSSVILFLMLPGVVCTGAKNGLLLWFNVIIPALLPFMIVSNFIVNYEITSYITRCVYPIFRRVFHISEAASYPVVIGLLSGYPLGAKTVADMYKQGAYSKEEAQYLLSFCNNASPMFMTEYVGVYLLGLKQPLLVLVCVVFGAFFNARLSLFFREKKSGKQKKKTLLVLNSKREKSYINSKRMAVMEALDLSILNAFLTIAKIGGYIMIFTILSQLIQKTLPIPVFLKVIGIGILEITSGGEEIAASAFSQYVKRVLLTGLCAFGGCSSVAQSASVLNGTDLSMGTYFWHKLRHFLITGVIASILF